MNVLRSTLALGAFFVLAVVLSACGSGVAGNSVADVAGNPITTQAFNHWLYVAAKGQASQSPGQPVIVPNDPPNFNNCIAQVRKQIPTLAKTPEKTIRSDCSTLFTSLSGQVMDFLIKAYWYQADAAKAHITITDAQVQTAFDVAKKQQFPTPAQFQTLLSSSGLTLQDILFRVRVDQIYMKLIAKHPTTVSAAQIQAYYSSHLAQFQTAESRNIRIVLTKTRATALAAKSALRKGSSWSAVAKRYSTDPTTKSKGGLLVGVTQGQQDQALNSAAFSAPANKLLGPVHGQFGFYVFEVTKITKATTRTLALASATIKQTLTTQLQSSAQTAVDSHAKKDWLHRTTCRKPYAMADCNGFKAPAASTTATAPSTATAPPTATATTAPPTATTPSTATSSTTK